MHKFFSCVLAIALSLNIFVQPISVLAEEIKEPQEEINEEEIIENTEEEIEETFINEENEEIVEEEIIEENIEEAEEIIEEEILAEELIEDEVVEEVLEEIEEIKIEVEKTENNNKYANILSSEPSVKGFVVRLYRNVLEREPDDRGFNNWVNNLNSKKITASSTVKGFFLSEEMKKRNLDNETYVQILYRTILNREADSKGLQNWVDRLNVGMSREHVINGFLDSKEFSNLCKNYHVNKGGSNKTSYYRDKNYLVTSFVSRMYKLVLGRKADTTGLENWCRGLVNKSLTGADLVTGFFFSKEFINKKLDNTEFVEIAYRVILDREGETSGINSWVDQLNKGKSRREVLSGFVDSKEFSNLCKKYGIVKGSLNKSVVNKSTIEKLNAKASNGVVTCINGFQPSSRAYNELVSAIKELENKGIKLSIVMMDIRTGKGVMYNPDTEIYSASSIKGPYCISLVESNPNAYANDQAYIKQLFTYSTNDEYTYLVNKYGMNCLRNYYNDIGVEFDIVPSRTIYTWYSARTYAKLWARMYQAFNNSATAKQAGAYLETNYYTAFRSATGLRAKSKSGWMSGGSLTAQNEGGIAYASNGDYIYAVLSVYAGDWSTFYRIHRALNALHAEIY